jgi:nucleotide-binding universal stress UspA family protein
MPVFGVSESGSPPPVRVVVAMDGSAASRRAAITACDIAAPDARILLVHVRNPSARALPASTLAAHAERLQRGHFGRVEMVQLDGDPATELLSFANAHGVDLLAIGRTGETVRARGVMGAVATRMIRCTQCSFLATSP